MEDIRPYNDNDDQREQQHDNPAEWEAARLEVDDVELPFYLPRD